MIVKYVCWLQHSFFVVLLYKMLCSLKCVLRLNRIIIIIGCMISDYNALFSDLVLLGMEEVKRNHPDFLPDMKEVINFEKRREYAKLIQELQRYQAYPYNLNPIEVNITCRELNGLNPLSLATKQWYCIDVVLYNHYHCLKCCKCSHERVLWLMHA